VSVQIKYRLYILALLVTCSENIQPRTSVGTDTQSSVQHLVLLPVMICVRKSVVGFQNTGIYRRPTTASCIEIT